MKWSVLFKGCVPSSDEPPIPSNNFSQEIWSCGPAWYFPLVIICLRRDSRAPEADPAVLGTGQNKTQPGLLCRQLPVTMREEGFSNLGGATGHPLCSDSHHLVQTQG